MKSARFFLVIIALLLQAAANLTAQTSEGRIVGTVYDQAGAVIADAKVTVTNTATDVSRSLSTTSAGVDVVPNLPPGPYRVVAEAAGFKKAISTPFSLEVSRDVRVDLKLQAGAVTETVTVSSDATLVDSIDSKLNGVLSNKAILELPVQARDFQNLLALHPGVERDPGGGFHSVTSNGLRPDDNNYVIDGATDNDAYYGDTVVNGAGIQGTPASILPLDAIQEFNTQEDPQADFGEKPGVVVNIGIKSGTDQVHGTGYYFHRNAAFDARNYFNPSPQPVSALLLHEFGSSIGGPIIKGKWFYFANYEGVRSKVGNPYNVYVPVTGHLPAGFDWDDPTRLSVADALTSTGCDQVPLPPTCSQLSLNLLKYLPYNPGFTADPVDPTIINFDRSEEHTSELQS